MGSKSVQISAVLATSQPLTGRPAAATDVGLAHLTDLIVDFLLGCPGMLTHTPSTERRGSASEPLKLSERHPVAPNSPRCSSRTRLELQRWMDL